MDVYMVTVQFATLQVKSADGKPHAFVETHAVRASSVLDAETQGIERTRSNWDVYRVIAKRAILLPKTSH